MADQSGWQGSGITEMRRLGTQESGFAVGWNGIQRTIHVRAWGFWPPDIAASFGDTVADCCRTAKRAANLAIDASELAPMRDEGQASFAALMSALPQLGITKVSVTTSSQLTRMQLFRITKTHASQTQVQFIAGEARPR